jgi:hypothetical protein
MVVAGSFAWSVRTAGKCELTPVSPDIDALPRAHPFTSMLLAIDARGRRVIGDMVAEACQVCKPLQFAALL